jgi:peptidoglycan/LPS O-acetylase OafA/YrhL
VESPRIESSGQETRNTAGKPFSARQKSGFNPALSGVRGTASFAVVIFHATMYLQYPISALTNTFYLGVPVFLMMSMFLLLNRLDSNSNLKHYFVRRIIRIWPIYYGCLITFDIFFHIPFWAFIRYLFFVEYYVNPFGYFPVSVFWTLQLEEAMYILIPVIQRMKWKMWLASGFILLGFGYLAAISGTPFSGHPTVYFEMYLPVPLIAYGFGVLGYLGKIPLGAKWLSLLGISGYTVINLLSSNSIVLGHYLNFIFTNIVLYAITLTGFAAIVCSPPRFLRWLALLGEESYALYAIHYALVVLFGLVGIVYALIGSFLIELALRPKEIIRRLFSSYPELGKIKSQISKLFSTG